MLFDTKVTGEMRYIHLLITILTVTHTYQSHTPLLDCFSISICYLRHLMEIRLRLFIFFPLVNENEAPQHIK